MATALLTAAKTQYIIKNSGYNYEIQPDQEVNFGYCVTGEGLEIPKVFEICSQRTDKAENEYIVSLNVTNDWDNGFTGEIKIQNLSAEPIPRLLACLISEYIFEVDVPPDARKLFKY